MAQLLCYSSTSPQPSPFSSISNELLAQIFSHIHSVSAKLRLGRVSTRFHQCLQLDQSWKFNTELSVSQTSIESYLPLIKRFPRFTSFKLNNLQKPRRKLDAFVRALEGQRHKFQLSLLDVCVCYQSASLESFLSLQSHPFLSSLHLRSAHSDQLAISLIQSSDHLSYVSLNMDAYQDYTRVMAALRKKPLIGLTLASSLPGPPFPIHAAKVVDVINSIPNYSLRHLALINCHLDQDFRLFTDAIEYAACQSITHLDFSNLVHDRIDDFFGLFCPGFMRNLVTMSFTQKHDTTYFGKTVYVEAIRRFLMFEEMFLNKKSNATKTSGIQD